MPSSYKEEAIKRKYGGILPKKPPLISKDHESAYFSFCRLGFGVGGLIITGCMFYHRTYTKIPLKRLSPLTILQAMVVALSCFDMCHSKFSWAKLTMLVKLPLSYAWTELHAHTDTPSHSVGYFSLTGKITVKYAGAEAMYFVSKNLKKKYNITDECAAFYEAAETWVDALNGREFLGGSKPNLADLAVFGAETHMLSEVAGIW